MAKTKQDKLEMVLNRYKAGRDYAEAHEDRWEKNWKSYNGIRTHMDYFGVANDFVPETFTIVESIKSNIMGGKQRFEYYPKYPEQSADTKALNSLVECYWYANSWPMATANSVDDMLKLGNGFVWAFWDADNGVVPKYVPLADNFIDPAATSYEDERYAGFRYLASKSELEKETIIDPETGESKKRYKNLSKLEQRPNDKEGSTMETDKEKKDEIVGSTLNDEAKKDQVEIIYYVDHERLIQVANRCEVIEDIETPFMREETVIESVDDMGNPVPVTLPEIQPFIPRAPFRDYIDGSQYYAKGEIDVIRESQERLNDTSSQKRDNLSYMLNRNYVLDPTFADKIDEFDNVPGAIFTVPPNAIDTLPVQPIGADADNEMFRTKDEMRRATAADEIIQGAGQDKGQITATEVRAQLSQAGTRFSTKINQLERESFKILADIFFKLIQINVTQEMAVRVIGPEGAEFKNYNPGEYLGDYEPRVMLDTTAAAAKEEEKQNAMQFFQLASQQPFVDQRQLFKKTATDMFGLDVQELDNLIMEEQPALPPEMLEMGAGPGTPQASTIPNGPAAPDIPEGALM